MLTHMVTFPTHSNTLGIKCSEFGQLECPHFSDVARVFFGSLVIKLIFEICATLTHLWGRLGDVKKNMYNLGE